MPANEVRIISDSTQPGADYYWSDRRGAWVVINNTTLEISLHHSLALVTLADGEDADDGLNQEALGCDLDCPRGLWLIDAASLHDFAPNYVAVQKFCGRWQGQIAAGETS